MEAAPQLAAARLAQNDGNGVAADVDKVTMCFWKAGGVARFCLEGDLSYTENVDTATTTFLTVENGTNQALKEAIALLVNMHDAVGTDKKIYPGLVMHCIPHREAKTVSL